MFITGMGVTSAVGQNRTEFIQGLLNANNAFQVMSRPGRQEGEQTAYLGAEIQQLPTSSRLSIRSLRTTTLAGQVAVQVLEQAWQQAQLDQVDPERIGLIIGGSNLQQRELLLMRLKRFEQSTIISPYYAMNFMDTDLTGLCSEIFQIKGFAYTVGGASASGQLAIIQAIEALRTQRVDICIALGSLFDISYWECAAFSNAGSMGSRQFKHQPELACRPFDKNRDGFIYGEACAAVVLETTDDRLAAVRPLACIRGWGEIFDGNRKPNPSEIGEIKVIERALAKACWQAKDIDYINPHGTGSTLGDNTEIAALKYHHLEHALINTTKSIVGHSLMAAGLVEVVATVLQLQQQQFHPSRNLIEPIAPEFNWVRNKSVTKIANKALTISIGFSGINTALCIERYY